MNKRHRQRHRLCNAAATIAAAYGKAPSPLKAFSKLFLAPRWIGPDQRAPGLRRWKAGEIVEWVAAVFDEENEAAGEWGDVGYYVAQTWRGLWTLYRRITPDDVIEQAVEKFERRANGLDPHPSSRHYQRFRTAADTIAHLVGKAPLGPFEALGELFVVPRWVGARRGRGLRRWRGGPLIRWAWLWMQGKTTESRAVWGDVGYYVAQTWRGLWTLYRRITPASVIEQAIKRYEEMTNQ
jgi:hypothetical protein